jgi:hypothetical protein
MLDAVLSLKNSGFFWGASLRVYSPLGRTTNFPISPSFFGVSFGVFGR